MSSIEMTHKDIGLPNETSTAVESQVGPWSHTQVWALRVVLAPKPPRKYSVTAAFRRLENERNIFLRKLV